MVCECELMARVTLLPNQALFLMTKSEVLPEVQSEREMSEDRARLRLMSYGAPRVIRECRRSSATQVKVQAE